MDFTIHPELPAVDLQRARSWYKDKLGLDPVTVGGEPFDPDADLEYEEMLYDTGTAKFGVYQSRHAGKNLATAARLMTDNFDAAHAELLANGVVFEIYPIEGNFDSDEDQQPYWDNGALVIPDGEKTAWFKDSEANILAIGSSDLAPDAVKASDAVAGPIHNGHSEPVLLDRGASFAVTIQGRNVHADAARRGRLSAIALRATRQARLDAINWLLGAHHGRHSHDGAIRRRPS